MRSLPEQSHEYREHLSKNEKEEKREYGRNRYNNMHDKKKKKRIPEKDYKAKNLNSLS